MASDPKSELDRFCKHKGVRLEPPLYKTTLVPPENSHFGPKVPTFTCIITLHGGVEISSEEQFQSKRAAEQHVAKLALGYYNHPSDQTQPTRSFVENPPNEVPPTAIPLSADKIESKPFDPKTLEVPPPAPPETQPAPPETVEVVHPKMVWGKVQKVEALPIRQIQQQTQRPPKPIAVHLPASSPSETPVPSTAFSSEISYKNLAQEYFQKGLHVGRALNYQTSVGTNQLFFCQLTVTGEENSQNVFKTPEGSKTKKGAEQLAAKICLDHIEREERKLTEKQKLLKSKLPQVPKKNNNPQVPKRSNNRRQVEQNNKKKRELPNFEINKKHNKTLDWQTHIWIIILHHFDDQQLCILSMVCIQFQELASQNTVWVRYSRKPFFGNTGLMSNVLRTRRKRYNTLFGKINSILAISLQKKEFSDDGFDFIPYTNQAEVRTNVGQSFHVDCLGKRTGDTLEFKLDGFSESAIIQVVEPLRDFVQKCTHLIPCTVPSGFHIGFHMVAFCWIDLCCKKFFILKSLRS